MAEAVRFTARWSSDPDPFAYPDVNVAECEVFTLPLAPGRYVYGIRHPEITLDTARRFLADLVLTAWDKENKR